MTRPAPLADRTLLADPATYARGVPRAEFRRRLRHAPVDWVEERPLDRRDGDRSRTEQGSGYWAVTRHASVTAASRDTRTFSSAARGAFLADPRTPEQLHRTRQLLVSMDAPEHTRARRLIGNAFGPPAVRRLRGSIWEAAVKLVQRCRARGEFDLVSDLAAPLPLTVLAEVLGIPPEDRPLLLRWSNNLVGFDDPEYGGGDVEVYRSIFTEAFGYAADVARQRRRAPADDIVSVLATAEADGERLSDAEFGQLWLLLVVAGNETTRHAISGGVQALLDHPDQLERLAADPGLLPSATEEILRWTTPIMQFRRTLTRDATLDGTLMREGDKAVLYYIAANQDDTVFTAPERFDITRDPNPHLAFGTGPHFCLGAALAREEIAVLLGALHPHLRRLRRAGEPVRLESNFMNGLKYFPVRFDD
ncbi:MULTISPECIES: cytochrome P450 [unclassified Streptomyces]|uniref:cytochrome P450 n=1 Tax=unclassified Streptomyces TaxID=2593676 RepID=UPI000374E3A9|nr:MULTISPECIES: cytochrome P450 [unclassified Streptomyces]MYT29275.1 cytochrome P450 [Streptomyces sp. SID8354]